MKIEVNNRMRRYASRVLSAVCLAGVVMLTGCMNRNEKIEQFPVPLTTLQETTQTTTQEATLEQLKMQSITVEPQCKPAMGFTFELPEDWTYEVNYSDDEPTSDVAAIIRPSDETRHGSITIECMKGFGVCGTGLEHKEIVINGKEAWQGFYDGNPVWTYILLKKGGEGPSYVIMNSAEWYQDYADVVEAILATVEFKMYE